MNFKDDDELNKLVRDFETCEINLAEFKHQQHLAVALWYLRHLNYEGACEKMRGGLQRLTTAYGQSGYHETITLFWLKRVRRFLSDRHEEEATFALANRLADVYGNKTLISEYYSEETLNSAKARNEWVEPDLQALEGAN